MSRSTADSAPSGTLPTPKERRRLREALALSEEQVAEAMGVTKATVRSWETGRSTPRGRKREAYAKLLGSHEPQAPEPQTTEPQAPEAASQGAASHGAASLGPESRRSQPPAPARDRAQPPPLPRAQPQASASADVRPRAAAKRAAKPPRAPSPAPGSAPGPAREGPPKQPERLKPVASEAPVEPDPVAPSPTGPSFTPEQAFDALYAHAAPGLVHQTYLLTGRRALSRESVERAFHHAWEHWPEVAVDADPVGWVRAVAYEYALSPWHRLRRAHKHPDAPPAEATRRALLGALLELPPAHRRTVLLYDGLGLDLPDTAAETEASTPAAANRLLHARTVLGQRLPELAEPEALHHRLSTLVSEAPAAATLPAARAVRAGSEHRARTWTRAVLGVTAALIVVTGFTVATAPTRYIPVNAPGETVNGVPVRGGPQKLGPEDLELRDKLRSDPNPGPERLVPAVG
ncbi:helix-turn-helix domain-containing protein [Streptomyces sp. SP18ES09]|uniref:helix-turn-helix domain-containing protein n=1 Tax=Streptomyces sp. SP18ES09 TaxID=3002532 RepID=UPI002E7A9725|nr:helix-turn-helix domain-containing protein [Streptomyces sp. SP18ES09]MEE1817342.1 helix-turn-helix domain-containing protein [Streptomyces sp. SP18ES09]